MIQRLTDMARVVVERWIRGGFRQLSVIIGRLTSMSCIERKLSVHFTKTKFKKKKKKKRPFFFSLFLLLIDHTTFTLSGLRRIPRRDFVG